MRIALTSLYLPGSSKIGVGYQVHHFANRLVARGHEVTVFSPDRPGEEARYTYAHVDPGPSLRTFRFAWRLRGVDLPGSTSCTPTGTTPSWPADAAHRT